MHVLSIGYGHRSLRKLFLLRACYLPFRERISRDRFRDRVHTLAISTGRPNRTQAQLAEFGDDYKSRRPADRYNLPILFLLYRRILGDVLQRVLVV